MIHEVEIACPASVDSREAGGEHQSLEAGTSRSCSADLELPEGAKMLAADLEAVVVECIVPVEMPEEGAGEAVPGEPEVIGARRKRREEEE